MGIYRNSNELPAILREGMEEIISLDTEAKVLRSSLNLFMAISEATSGYIMKLTGENTWVIEEPSYEIYMPAGLIEKLLSDRTFNISDEIIGFLPHELQGKINTVIPLPVDGTINTALLMDRNNNPSLCSLLSLCLSPVLSRLAILRQAEDMKAHYEEILVKKETAERVASLGYVAAGLAHEIKNPLVSIKTLAQLLPERFDDEEFRNRFSTIAISEIDRIEVIVSDLLDFAKSSEPKFAPLDIKGLMEEVITLLSARFDECGIVVIRSYSGNIPPIHGDRAQIKQLLLNIMLNSLEAMQKGGGLTAGLSTGKGSAAFERIIIKLTDTGTGIEKENLLHVFEPFFTTKGKGTGLGLSICKRIVSRHGGTIHVDSIHKQGTTVTIELPVENVN